MIRCPLKFFGRTETITNPNHRIHGDEGPTKRDVVEYYLKVAPRLLPFLRKRPLSTVWLPNESIQEFRFTPTTPPRCLGRFRMHRLPCPHSRRLESYLSVPDADTLTALVDRGCLSFHPWSSTVGAPLHPDRVVFNLDGEAIAFREVRNAALLLRELLDACGLPAWVKTTGGRGLHVLVPVSGSASFEDARLVAETIVTRAIRREPTLFSGHMRRARRRGRILIDTSRNAYGATVIAPYAVATSGLVSTLLQWDELRRPMYPEDFDMARVVAREGPDSNNERSFFTADQSIDSLVQSKRGRAGRNAAKLRECTNFESGGGRRPPRRPSPIPTVDDSPARSVGVRGIDRM